MACVIGPSKYPVDHEHGFEVEYFEAVACKSCKDVSIKAPESYEGTPFSHGIVSAYYNEILVSKSIHSSVSEDGSPEFYGVVNTEKGYSHQVTFEYGEGRCMRHKFVYNVDTDAVLNETHNK